MKSSEFEKLSNLYTQRYGKWSMEPETMEMWYSKLKVLEFNHVKEAFHQLIGEHDRAFGWKRVFLVVDALFPPESEVIALERKWKNNPEYTKDQEKRKELSIIMRSLIKEIEERKRTGKEIFDWLPEYARHFVEVWGESESRRICAKMRNYFTTRKKPEGGSENVRMATNATEDRFISLVNENLRSV